MEQIPIINQSTLFLLIVPFFMVIGMTIAGGKAWGSLTRGLKTVSASADKAVTEVEKLRRELRTDNGRTVYVTRTECGEEQNQIVRRIDSLCIKMEGVDEKRDEQWTKIVEHMGRVEEFMREKSC